MSEGTTKWSLERELIAMAGGGLSLPEALARLSLLKSATERPFDVVLVDDWKRGGTETYIASFRVDQGIDSRHFFLKALVPFPGTMTVQEAVDRYLARAKAMCGVGIATPRTYAASRGTLLQEYVPTSLAEAISSGMTIESATPLIEQALAQRVAVGRGGFDPLQFLSDLRTDGKRVVLVDLGSDLVPCRAHVPDVDSVKNECLRWLKTAVGDRERRDRLGDVVVAWARSPVHLKERLEI
jgi:hypothetical protein